MRRAALLLAVVGALLCCPAVADADSDGNTARCRVTGRGVTGSPACRVSARRFARAALRVGEGPLDTGRCERSYVGRPHWACVVFLSSGDVVAGSVRGRRVWAKLVA